MNKAAGAYRAEFVMLQESHEAAAQGVVPEEHQATPPGTLRAVSLSFCIRAAHDTPLAGSKQVSCRARSFATHVMHSTRVALQNDVCMCLNLQWLNTLSSAIESS